MDTSQQVKTYPTEEAAWRRAAQLQLSGIYTGVVPCGDRWRLMHDPEDAPRSHRAAAAED